MWSYRRTSVLVELTNRGSNPHVVLRTSTPISRVDSSGRKRPFHILQCAREFAIDPAQQISKASNGVSG